MKLGNGEFLHGDCLQLMNDIPDNSVDMILCDLPYGKTQNTWDKVIDIPTMWAQIRHVTKPTSTVVLMAAFPLAAQLICSNLPEFRYDLIWQKDLPTGFLNANRQPLRIHETILVFYRKPPLFSPQKTTGHTPMNGSTRKGTGGNYGNTEARSYGGATDRFPTSIMKFNSVNNNAGKVHTTQKPVPLMEWLIRSYTKPGDVVLDFVAGSGTTAIAAENTKRRWICIEKDETYFNVAVKRVQDAFSV